MGTGIGWLKIGCQSLRHSLFGVTAIKPMYSPAARVGVIAANVSARQRISKPGATHGSNSSRMRSIPTGRSVSTGFPVHPVGNGAGYVGLLWVFHNANSRQVNSFNQFFGTMDAHLVFSYDGHRFFRGKREPFLARNSIPHAGSAQIRPACIVETENEIRIYSEANRGAHGRERSEQRQKPNESLATLMLHRLRKDGWMYLESGGDWGRFQTKPFALFSPEIKINANAAYGEVRFQLTDEKSEPIEDFSFDDCQPLRGSDALTHSLAWKNADLQSVLNQPLRLEVEFRQANIYAFEMAHHFLDAQDMWLLKDGKPIPAKHFDF